MVIYKEEFLKSLNKEEKRWLSNSVIGMICADKEIDESEVHFIQLAIDLLDCNKRVQNVSDIIFNEKELVLKKIIVNDRSKAYEMLSIMASVAISDGRLSKSEERFLVQCGEMIGFDKEFSLEISRVSYEKLKVLAMEKKLIDQASTFIY